MDIVSLHLLLEGISLVKSQSRKIVSLGISDCCGLYMHPIEIVGTPCLEGIVVLVLRHLNTKDGFKFTNAAGML